MLREEDQCAEPGPWSNDRTPYLVGLMDMCMIGGWVHTLKIKKAARMGVSEGVVRNVMAYREDTKAGPAMLVNATREKTEEIFERQLVPLFEHTPRLKRHYVKSGNNSIRLRKTVIDLGWPNSPITMADRSIRDIYGDETNKWPRFAKQEASPGPLLDVRRDTFRDQSLMVLLSSPTHSSATISLEVDACADKIHGEVPCPKCGKYQVYNFWKQCKYDKTNPIMEGIKDKKVRASRILEHGLAYYECVHCEERWTDDMKEDIALKMVFVFDGDSVTEEDIEKEHKELEERMGRKVERKYNRVIWKGRRPEEIGVNLSGMFSPWRSYSRFLSEFFRSLGDPGKMQNFRNSWLGEDYEYEEAEISEDGLEQKVNDGGDRLKVPHWASCIIATADTQETHFYYTVRAWGKGHKSQLIDHGMVDSFAALRERTLDREFEVNKEGWGTVIPVKLFIDAGGGAIKGQNTTRTWQVYQFALSDTARIVPVRGHGGAYEMENPLQRRTIDYTPPDQEEWDKSKVKITYLRIDTDYYKDLLASRIANKPEASDYWGLHNEKDGDYLAQITSEHKVLEGQGAKQRFTWKQKTSGAANHFLDCENYQVAAADFVRVDTMETIEEIMKKTIENEDFIAQNRNPKPQTRRRW